jgi:hypothetical protein
VAPSSNRSIAQPGSVKEKLNEMSFVLVFMLMVKSLTAFEVEVMRNDKVSSFVRDLITDHNNKHPAMKDVAIFEFYERSSRDVADAFEDVRKAIPTENPVTATEMERITNRRLPEAAFIIIVTDAFVNV